MREYKKPVMQVERFVPNTNIAKGCGWQDVETETRLTVYCFVGGQQESSTGQVVNYNGTNYWVWYLDDGQKPVGDTGLLANILIAGGLISDASQGHGWHAGEITYDKSTDRVYVADKS